MASNAWQDFQARRERPAQPYYATGPRVPASAALERHYRWGTESMPRPGELEYLGKRINSFGQWY